MLTMDVGYADRPIGDIAATLPGAAAIFRRHKLDFCCGGRVTLARAAADRGIALAPLEAELNVEAQAAMPVEAPALTEDLIGMIETRYHAAHRRELPELLRFARRVEAVHRDNPAVPAGLANLLDGMGEELVAHMAKEEQILFPLMRAGGHPMITHPIAVMMAEHDQHGVHLRALEALTRDFVAPDDACATWRALYVGLKKLSDDLIAHIHTENNILFPRFRRV